MLTMIRLRLLLLIVPLFQFVTVTVTAFPDHLLGPGGCSTELATDEVIMNSMVTSYEESRDQDIRIAVKSKDGTILQSPISITEADVPMTFEMVVLNPNRLENVQYVMDMQSAGSGSSSKLEFGLCKGEKRVTGKVGDVHKLTIDSIPDTDDPIQVWAGWACSHETVTLTNYFIFQKEEAASLEIQEILNEVKELEQADEKEREAVNEELGDDDATNVGDLEEQLDNMHADANVREQMEKMIKNRAQRKDKANRFNAIPPNLDKYKDLIQEKKIHAKDLPKMTKLDQNWEEVKKRLTMDAKFQQDHHDAGENTMMAQHQKMMEKKRDAMMKTGDRHSEQWKERLQKKRAMLLQQAKADNTADDDDEDKPVKRRGRESYEEQDEDIVWKELLMGVLGVLIVNWLILQLCLWNDKRKKGRRNN